MSFVNVIVPCYNQGQYLAEAVDSVLAQTCGRIFNIFIIDDFSTDNTPEVIESLKEKANEKGIDLQTERTWENIGSSAARKMGMAWARNRGDYILFLDADDKIQPDFIQKTVDFLDSEEGANYAFAYTWTRTFGAREELWPSPEYNFFELVQRNYIPYCSMLRRSVYFQVGGHDSFNRNYWEDYELWIELGSYGFYGKLIPEFLFNYRISEESLAHGKRAQLMSPVYKSYIVNRRPEVFPPQWKEQARLILSEYPDNIMEMTPAQQEEVLKQKGLM